VVKAANNPLLPQGQQAAVPSVVADLPGIREELAARGQSGSGAVYGTIVMVEVSKEDTAKLGPGYSFTGQISIFDVVNNPVVVRRPMVFDEERTKRLYYVWDGRNDGGRAVGTGTYVAIVNISDDQGKRWTEQLLLGVKR
jgi:hypothetical protein